MPSCKECGSTNMLIKVGENDYLCFDHYIRNRPADSELVAIVEESVRKHLVYLGQDYKRKMRRVEHEKGSE
jgi:hypothetical protein